MACSASMLATRLSAARNSRDIECAKYSARLTNPNATQSTMINTEPSSPGQSSQRRYRVVLEISSFIAVLRWLALFDWCAPERRSAQQARREPRASGAVRLLSQRVESEA